MLILFMSTIALADPTSSVVAAGDGLSSAPPLTGAATWVSVLGDCLSEESVGRFSVVDRTGPEQTVAQLRESAPDLLRLDPAVVVLGVGAAERASDLSIDDALIALPAALSQLDGHAVVLLGPPPTAAIDAGRIRAFNDALRTIAVDHNHVSFLDVMATWPEAPTAPLVAEGRLTEMGHARVGALVCAAVPHAEDRSPRPETSGPTR